MFSKWGYYGLFKPSLHEVYCSLYQAFGDDWRIVKYFWIDSSNLNNQNIICNYQYAPMYVWQEEGCVLGAKSDVTSLGTTKIIHSGDCSIYAYNGDICDCGALRKAVSSALLDPEDEEWELWEKHIDALEFVGRF